MSRAAEAKMTELAVLGKGREGTSTTSKIAQVLDIPPCVARHALRRFVETERFRVDTSVRPFTYSYLHD